MRHHGWDGEAAELHRLSVEGNWPAMGQIVTDDMLAEFAIIGTYEEIVPQLKERWSGICPALFIPLPAAAWSNDGDRVVRALMRDC